MRRAQQRKRLPAAGGRPGSARRSNELKRTAQQYHQEVSARLLHPEATASWQVCAAPERAQPCGEKRAAHVCPAIRRQQFG